jgi:proteic killer suppression protein
LREAVGKFSLDFYRKALRKLMVLDAAERLDDLKIPSGNQLEKLAGDRSDGSKEDDSKKRISTTSK